MTKMSPQLLLRTATIFAFARLCMGLFPADPYVRWIIGIDPKAYSTVHFNLILVNSHAQGNQRHKSYARAITYHQDQMGQWIFILCTKQPKTSMSYSVLPSETAEWEHYTLSNTGNTGEKYVHFNSPISSPAYNFVSHEIHTINLIGMSRQIRLQFIRLQIPDLLHHIVLNVNTVLTTKTNSKSAPSASHLYWR
jgi:hypothetical protein